MLKRKILVLLTAIGLIIGCGKKSKKDDAPEDLAYTTLTPNVSRSDLSLLATISYTAKVEGCVSGFVKTGLTEADASISIPDLDSNCQFKLNSVVVDGETFDTSGQSYAENSSFIVTGSASTQLTFSVNSQIDTPIAGPQSVNITFATLQTGAGGISSAATTAGVSVSGAAPIDLEIGIASITAIDSVTGAGSFEFKLACAAAVANGLCNSVDLATVSAGLAKQADYGGLSLDLNQCSTLANSGSTGTILAAGDPDVANGGLLIGAITGPAPLYGAENTELVLAIATSEGGCKYFGVTVESP